MAVAFVLAAYVAGLGAKLLKLPPLIGYLVAGFALHLFGFKLSDDIQLIADLGITLMLFTIGIKINLRELLSVPVWGSALGHMAAWSALCLGFTGLVALAGVTLLDMRFEQVAVIVFALSFSSTVCAIKVLEDASELKSRQSTIAIGVLIIQDLVAVVFLVLATGAMPSIWALSLLALPFLRPAIDRFLTASGHGELLPLAGVALPLGAYALFDLLNIKGDLGALVVGMLIANTSKASELYKSLISFKDIFLIAFFLSIGLSALPTLEMFLLSASLLLLLPIKFVLFFSVFCLLCFRVRTAFLASLLLSNFSEFGLIVAALSVREGMIGEQWLVVLAIAAALSFVITSVLYKKAHSIYCVVMPKLQRFQRERASKLHQVQVANKPEVIIIGMGRVGAGAYKALVEQGEQAVWGVEVDASRVTQHEAEGMHNVIVGDGDDLEFWEAQDLSKVRLIMLAVPAVEEMLNVLDQLKRVGYSSQISAVAQYEDDRCTLRDNGVDVVFNYYLDVGNGFANASQSLLEKR